MDDLSLSRTLLVSSSYLSWDNRQLWTLVCVCVCFPLKESVLKSTQWAYIQSGLCKKYKGHYQKVSLNPFNRREDSKWIRGERVFFFSHQVKIYPSSFFTHVILCTFNSFWRAMWFVCGQFFHVYFYLAIFYGDFLTKLIAKWRKQRKQSWHPIGHCYDISVWLSASRLTSRCLSEGASSMK